MLLRPSPCGLYPSLPGKFVSIRVLSWFFHSPTARGLVRAEKFSSCSGKGRRPGLFREPTHQSIPPYENHPNCRHYALRQSLYLHYGPRNPVARATSAAKGAVHDALEAAQKLVK